MTGRGKAVEVKEAPDENEDAVGAPNGEAKDAYTTKATAREGRPLDYTGAGTLGDIMSLEESSDGEQYLRNATTSEVFPRKLSKNSPTRSGLVTQDGGTLAARFGITSRLDRMAATANGNLQRLFSSYYDAPVHVVVDKCSLRSGKTWDRVVHLTVHNQTFCTATSEITVHDTACQSLVQSGRVGLGQLFRHLDKLPTFTLVDAGLSQQRALWRRYQLSCDELECKVHEVFVPQVWEIEPDNVV